MKTQTLLRLPEVLNRTGYSRSIIYEYAKHGLFTKPVKIGLRSVAWPDDEVSTITAARIAGKSKDEISQIVQLLHKKRLLDQKLNEQRQQLAANGEG